MTAFQLKLAITICTLTIAPLLVVGANAATYYVATTGSDSDPGTSTKPWRTVAYAASKMIAGDTTYVRGGTYSERIIRFARSGTQSAPIKLLNAPGESPVVDFISTANLDKILIQSSAGSSKAIGWIVIEGFELKNGYHGIKFYNSHDLIIRRNWIHHSSQSGILGMGGTRVLIDRNRINHNAHGTRSPGGHGMYANGSHYTITNNLFYDNWYYGLQQNGSSTSVYDPARHAGPEFGPSVNWVVANNTFAYQVNRSGMVVWGSTCTNARIENNIFYENAVAFSSGHTQGIAFSTMSCTGVKIRNNHFYASGSGGTVALGPGATETVHYTQSNNIINVSPPEFVNAPATLPASPNFALTEQSPVIDMGLSITATTTSFDDTVRPQGRDYDIGAYEYKAGGDAQSPSAPRTLQIQ